MKKVKKKWIQYQYHKLCKQQAEQAGTFLTDSRVFFVQLKGVFRYGTQWEQGYVTTFKPEDLNTLKALLASEPEPINQAGLHPTAEQIELYGFHLPNATFSNLMVSINNYTKINKMIKTLKERGKKGEINE